MVIKRKKGLDIGWWIYQLRLLGVDAKRVGKEAKEDESTHHVSPESLPERRLST